MLVGLNQLKHLVLAHTNLN